MKSIKRLLFDCDGVLVDSEIIAAEVMVETLSRYGILISVDYYLKNCTGKTYSGLVIELGETFNTKLPNTFLEEVTQLVDQRLTEDLKPIHRIHEVLECTRLPKAVVSNSDVYQIKHAIKHVNIAQHFTHIFSSQMVALPKPDPGVYLFAADELNVTPMECLVIEDSLSGASAALKAGMNVIGFTGGSHIVDGHQDKLMNIGVKKVTNNVDELIDLLSSQSLRLI